MSCHIVSCHIHVIMKTRDHHQQPQQVSGHPFLHSSLGVSNEALGAGQLSGPASRMPQISCASKLNSLAAWFHRDSHSGLWKSMEVPKISQYIGSKPLTDCYDHQPRGFEHCSTTTRCIPVEISPMGSDPAFSRHRMGGIEKSLQNGWAQGICLDTKW